MPLSALSAEATDLPATHCNLKTVNDKRNSTPIRNAENWLGQTANGTLPTHGTQETTNGKRSTVNTLEKVSRKLKTVNLKLKTTNHKLKTSNPNLPSYRKKKRVGAISALTESISASFSR